jgi:hypothetical protein
MIMHLKESPLTYANTGKNIGGEWSGGRERMRLRVRDCVLLRKGLGIRHKFESGLRKG